MKEYIQNQHILEFILSNGEMFGAMPIWEDNDKIMYLAIDCIEKEYYM